MAKIRTTTLGNTHRTLGKLYELHLHCEQEYRIRAALIHRCYHLYYQSIILHQPEVLHNQIGSRDFRNKQFRYLGSYERTYSDLKRAARSSICHDKIDFLAEVVDWYGRTKYASQNSLLLWIGYQDNIDWKKNIRFILDYEDEDLSICLLALEAWSFYEKREDIPSEIQERLLVEPEIGRSFSPYRILASCILQRIEFPLPAWAQGLDYWKHVPKQTAQIPKKGWSLEASEFVLNNEKNADYLVRQLSKENPNDWGWIVAPFISHISERVLTSVQINRLSIMLEDVNKLDWLDASQTIFLSKISKENIQNLLDHDFDFINWMKIILSRFTTDYQSRVRMTVQYFLRLSFNTSISETVVDVIIDFVKNFTESHYRGKIIHEVPIVLGNCLLHNNNDITWMRIQLEKLVEIEASAIPEATSDNLMFAIGRSLGRNNDAFAVQKACEKIKNPWIKGQLLRVLEPQNIPHLDIIKIIPTLSNPLAQRFALTHVYQSIGSTCSTETVIYGLEIASICKDYPEIRIAGIEGVLSHLEKRSDQKEILESFWKYHESLLELHTSFLWRIVELFIRKGVQPVHCLSSLRNWIQDTICTFSEVQKNDLCRYSSSINWQISSERSVQEIRKSIPTKVKESLLSSITDFQQIDSWTTDWSPDEWNVWMNSLLIDKPNIVKHLHSSVILYLIEHIGPSHPSASSITNLLLLLETQKSWQRQIDHWPDVHAQLIVLSQNPSKFNPQNLHLFGSKECQYAVLNWMVIGTRSELLTNWFGHANIREWLRYQQQWITKSEYGRLYPIVKQPQRKFLSYLTVIALSKVRPAQMLVAELLTRFGRPEELLYVKEHWIENQGENI